MAAAAIDEAQGVTTTWAIGAVWAAGAASSCAPTTPDTMKNETGSPNPISRPIPQTIPFERFDAF
jgi:hypothetical protein